MDATADRTRAAPSAGERRFGGSIRRLTRSFRHRNYRLFFSGQVVSLIGTWMQSVAQAWLVYRLTGSAFWLGAIGFAGQIPVLFVSPFAGAFADRHRRHRILVITQTTAMLLAFGLGTVTLLADPKPEYVFGFALALGVVNAFDVPARQAFLSEIVASDDLVNAIALNSSMVHLGRLVGPALAAFVVAVVGEGWCFIINGLSFVAVVAALLAMRLAPKPRPARHVSALQSMREGMAYAATHPGIRALLVLVAFVSITAMPFAVLLPVFADQVLAGGPGTLGALMSASGAGAFVFAIVLASRTAVAGLGRWIAVAAFALGVSLLAFAWAPSTWLATAAMVPAGGAMLTIMSGSNTLVQALVPDALRGRVMSVFVMMFLGTAPLGALAAGWAAEHVGAPLTVSVGAVCSLVAGAIFAWRLPSVRARSRLLLSQQMVGGEPAAAGSTPPPPPASA